MNKKKQNKSIISVKGKKTNTGRLLKFIKMKKNIQDANIGKILSSNSKNKIKILSKGNTGSRALIFTFPVQFKNKPNYKNKSRYAVFKITPVNTYMNNKNTSIHSEVNLHKFVTQLYYNRITPHVMLYYDKKSNTINKFPRHIRNLLSNINNNYREKKYVSIIQETWGGDLQAIEPFHNWAMRNRNKRSKQTDFKYILFHILYTLECFNHLNFKHNDLHLGNILILKYPVKKNKSRQYCVYDRKTKKEMYFELPFIKGWDTRLIDFDRSWKGDAKYLSSKYSKKIDNPSLTELTYDKEFGQSRKQNKKFDTYKFLFSLYKKLPEWHETKKWIETVIGKKLIKHGIVHSHKVIDNSNYGHLVHPVNGYNYVPPDTHMKSTYDMLTSSYFREFRLKRKPTKKSPSYYSMKTMYK